MNIIASTSRGRAVKPFFITEYHHISPYHFISLPGGKFDSLTTMAVNFIHESTPTPKPVHVYFLAGLPDLTHKIRNSNEKYEEVIFEEKPEIATHRMISTIIKTHETILAKGARAIFCPIIPINISKWNITRHSQKKTCFLKHQEKYPIMQKDLHQTITSINQFIVTINKENHLATPFIDRNLITSIPAKSPNLQSKYKFSYIQFRDGCHPSEKIAHSWASALISSIDKNQPVIVYPHSPRTSYQEMSEDEISPKRSWKWEKNPNTS